MDASKATQKYATNAGRAGDAYKSGIDSVKVNPMEKAAAAKDKYAAGVQKAIDNGDFERGCREVSLTDWQTAAREKGSKNYATGVKMGEGKYASYIQKAAPRITAISDEIQRMPSATEQDMEQRVLANIRKMRELKGIK